ncbi:unnamed protein product [Musa textilis]
MEIGGWRRGRGSSATVSLTTALDSGTVFAVKCAELGRSAILQREQRICLPSILLTLYLASGSTSGHTGLPAVSTIISSWSILPGARCRRRSGSREVGSMRPRFDATAVRS